MSRKRKLTKQNIEKLITLRDKLGAKEVSLRTGIPVDLQTRWIRSFKNGKPLPKTSKYADSVDKLNRRYRYEYKEKPQRIAKRLPFPLAKNPSPLINYALPPFKPSPQNYRIIGKFTVLIRSKRGRSIIHSNEFMGIFTMDEFEPQWETLVELSGQDLIHAIQLSDTVQVVDLTFNGFVLQQAEMTKSEFMKHQNLMRLRADLKRKKRKKKPRRKKGKK